ncbi:MAG TPA: pilus assembly protein [Anaerolineaceae bacterium]|nr:pilus assembly protein [Anaerolineaceae bacterium]HBA90915.1 pilus assembly protein [Anaerolineaceae bacterium]
MFPIRAVRGQGLVEYALILVLIALIVIVMLAVFGTQLGETYSNIVSNI